MAIGHRILCGFLVALSVVSAWAGAVGTIFVRAIEAAWVDAFPVAEPHLPTTQPESAAKVVGLAEVRAYRERRLQRIEREMSIGRGLVLAA